ncbi:MAG: redoxin domain-containing protein [Acidobacteria bacterium]|nr:redoxin domain-containing protein [Acidobacteriota bacterium]
MTNLIRLSGFALFLLGFSFIPQFALAQENARPEAPDEGQRLLEQGRDFAKNGRIQEAMQAFTRAAEIKNGRCAECFQSIGMIYFQVSQYQEAATAWQKAIALKPDNGGVLLNLLGVALYLQDDKKTLPEAITVFRQAIEASQDSLPKAHYNLGFALIKSGKEAEGVAELKKYLDLEPNSPTAESAREVIKHPKLASVQPATDFKVKGTDGKELSLKALRGKVVLLDFWASWCGPCRQEMPAVKQVWQKYGGENFVIIGINLDDSKSAFASYMKSEGITWPQYFDGQGWENKIARLYGVHAIPHTVLIDEEGIVRAVGLRGTTLYNKIADLLKQLKEQKSAATK